MISIKKVLLKIIQEFQPKPVLLWTNPNPSYNFSEQTIIESSGGWVSGKHLSDYNALEIHTNYNPGGNETYFANKIMTDGKDWVLFAHNNGTYPYGIRGVKASNSGIVFNSGMLIQGASASVNNAVAVPIKIYGIK